MLQTSASQTGLRRVDAGWLFLLAGAALVSSMVLIGPADDLVQLQNRRDGLTAFETDAVAQLQGYETFLEAIDEADPMLVRRLAAAQLNLIPENVRPIGLIGVELDAHVDDWIHETLPPPTTVEPPRVKDSWLRRLSSGPTRLWAMLAGILLVFIGLLPQAETAAEAELEASVAIEDELTLATNGEVGEYEDQADEFDVDLTDVDDKDDYENDDESEVDEPTEEHPHRRLIVTETGELLDQEEDDGPDSHEPPVQVVTISASSVH